MNIVLTVLAEEPENVFGDAIVEFLVTKDNTDPDKHILRGRFDGFIKNKGYIVLPLNSKEEKMFHEDKIATYPINKFDAISRRNMRIIWKILVNQKDFVVI